MRTEYDLGAHQETSRRRICFVCGRRMYESLLRECPEQGVLKCMYCCAHCSEHYQDMGGQGCRAADRGRGKKKAG